jgi:phosphopantetheinyl transferase (holo-ACP synthase)
MVETLINKPYLKLFWTDIPHLNGESSPLAKSLVTDKAKSKLIEHLYQQPFAIKKDTFGKPYIDEIDEHISISHTTDACSMVFTREPYPGIDIELMRPQLFKIMPKFLSELEREKHDMLDLKTLTILWSAKEAIFKWHGIGEVDFKAHILIKHIDFENSRILAEFNKVGYQKELELKFMEYKQHIVTYVKNKE